MKRFLFALALLFAAGAAQAACTGSSPTWSSTIDQASVASCVSSAASGDTINVAAGSATWSAGVSWTNKNIKIIGAGVGNSIITRSAPIFTVNMTAATQSWRISGFTFTGAAPNNMITLDSGGTTSPTKGWRIDHIRFNYSGAGTACHIQGITWGLWDHITLDGNGYQFCTIFGYMNSSTNENSTCSGAAPNVCFGNWYWRRGPNLGTDQAVYMEDFTVNFTATDESTTTVVMADLVYGGAAVIRYSNITHNYFITHSARGGDRGGMKWEVYRNTWSGTNFFRWAQIRSGTGLAFDNTVGGYSLNEISIDGQREDSNSGCESSAGTLGVCSGANSHDNNTESSGWQCLDGVGRGGSTSATLDTAANQVWAPWYSFNNGTTSTCASGGTCNNTALIALNCSQMAPWLKTIGAAHANGEVDYVNAANVGKGVLASRPATCTKGAGYWATDIGEWNAKNSGPDGQLYRCVSTNTWELYYKPYAYPHPLQVASGPAPPTNIHATILSWMRELMISLSDFDVAT